MVKSSPIVLSVWAVQLYDSPPKDFWLNNFVHSGWFGFVLTRWIALLLIVLAVRWLWRRSRVAGVSITVLLLLG